MPAHNFVDITGQQFGRLTVQTREGSTPEGKARWRCVCDCGEIVYASTGDLRSKKTRSCGCWQKSQVALLTRSHGQAHTAEYRIFRHMKARCHNPLDPAYGDYGGRGITVDYASFEAFLADVGPRPGPEFTIERIQNELPYRQGNVRWATWTDQQNNKRNTRYVDVAGKSIPRAVLARQMGISYWAMRTIDERSPDTRARRLIEYEGQQWTLAALARHLGISRGGLSNRLNKGYGLALPRMPPGPSPLSK